MAVITINDFSKLYGNKLAVNDLTLSVEAGEIYGFIGPNGAGKTTTIKSMMNFLIPSDGKISLMGMDSVKEAKAIRQQVGFASSDVRYAPNLTTYQLLKYVAKLHGITNSKEAIGDLVELLDINPKQKLGKLSLGNRKKAALAVALLPNPQLLILDEPTNGLDPLVTHRFFAEIERRNELGVTVFLSSHDLGEIQEHADRAAFIRDGRLITVRNVSSDRAKGKVITIQGDNLPIEPLISLGATILQEAVHEAKFLYPGHIQAVLPLLEQNGIDDVTITKPELEDQFMALYEGDDDDARS